jgi:predicted nuclease with RNAse H fold
VRSLGVDVGQHQHDAVLLDGPMIARAPVRFTEPRQLEDLIEAWCPEVVAVDSPPWFAPSGRSRLAERSLQRRGIQIFPCPCAERAEGKPFFDWMRTGFCLFVAAARVGFDVGLDSSNVRGRALEVYPHGSAVALRRARPPAGTLRSTRSKRAWRAKVLADNGVDTAVLSTVHQVDAALAALTGVRALEGTASAVGAAGEGVIIVPVPELLEHYDEELSRVVRPGSAVRHGSVRHRRGKDR